MLLNFANIFIIAFRIPNFLILIVSLLNILLIVNLILFNLQRTKLALGPNLFPKNVLEPHMRLNLGHPLTTQSLSRLELHQLGNEVQRRSAPRDGQQRVVDFQRLRKHRLFYLLFRFSFERTLKLVRGFEGIWVLSRSLVRRLEPPERNSLHIDCGFSVTALQGLIYIIQSYLFYILIIILES